MHQPHKDYFWKVISKASVKPLKVRLFLYNMLSLNERKHIFIKLEGPCPILLYYLHPFVLHGAGGKKSSSAAKFIWNAKSEHFFCFQTYIIFMGVNYKTISP